MSRLNDILLNKEANYLLPFCWQHGDHTAKIPEQIARIAESGCRALCVEARPHPDFAGPGWWRDMDVILAECKKRGMKVWILDDKHFPTGFANGAVERHPELRRWNLAERHVDVAGPAKGVSLLLCESTNVEHAGFTPSESKVGSSFENIFLRPLFLMANGFIFEVTLRTLYSIQRCPQM